MESPKIEDQLVFIFGHKKSEKNTTHKTILWLSPWLSTLSTIRPKRRTSSEVAGAWEKRGHGRLGGGLKTWPTLPAWVHWATQVPWPTFYHVNDRFQVIPAQNHVWPRRTLLLQIARHLVVQNTSLLVQLLNPDVYFPPSASRSL